MNSGVKAIRPCLDDMIKSVGVDGTSWRNSGFCPPPGGGEFGAGVVNLSPGWFQQSHEVSTVFCCCPSIHINMLPVTTRLPVHFVINQE